MAETSFAGVVPGSIWRGQETGKEILYCLGQGGRDGWVKIEYSGDLMLERANYMAGLLSADGNPQIGIEYDELAEEGRPPYLLVTEINVKTRP